MARTSLSQLTLGVSLAALASWAAPAVAQENGLPVDNTEQPEVTPDSGADPTGEDIVVTGSRLARDPNAVAPSPIQTVTAADIRSTGQTDVTEVLREVPALLSSGTIEDSIERGGGGIGQATLNLRGLGSARTLVLVNGRRHVSGVAGAQTVDTATIPRALIQSVDILTGGASAIYGADAVTGVVNFNLRRDYQGTEIATQVGISEKGDGRTFAVDGIWGRNFIDNRLNITVAGSYSRGEELKGGDREFSRDNNQASAGLTYQNPNRRFQLGDITSATPNFAQRFSIAAGRYPIGAAIPTDLAAFQALFPGRTPTPAEQALIDRAANSPAQAIARRPTFAISSASGLIARADFDTFKADTNSNGVEDCLESLIGFRYSRVSGLGGCLISLPGGGVRPFQDGIISTNTNQIGGDGIAEGFNFVSLIPQSQRYDVNLLTNFELSPAAVVFAELKYVHTDTFSQPGAPNSFYDQLLISPDNPFIPAILRADANEAGGLRVSRDFTDIPSLSKSDRDTYRAVLGVRGEITPNLDYQIYGNYGRTDDATSGPSVLPDRLFAAVDAVAGPNGQPTCASNLNPSRVPPASEFFPVITPGFFTFTPGANSGCVPVNLFNGPNGVSPEALAFIAPDTTTRSRIDQLVIAAELSGDTSGFFNLPGGAVQFAVGAEYRRERSRTRFDPLDLGLLPANSPAGAAGTFVGDIDPDKQSLTFDTTVRTLNTQGEYDVKEIFGEIRIPIVADQPFFHELTLEGAARYSDYSTIGGTFTWNVNGTYAPVRDLRIRGTYSKAVRAPNIFELFSPQQGTTFRPIDPCDVNNITALLGSSDPANVQRGERRRTNCAAAGIPATFTDPLTARFSGTTGGNPDLTEETATTFTAGAVIQPRFLPGLTISGDYYDIKIENGIAAVTSQNIVNSCYEAETFPNPFCELFDRGPNFGFTFLRQTQLNFGRLETAGVDATIAYNFALGENRFALRATANWTDKLNQFFDPVNPEIVDPELGETGFPEWSGVGSATWSNGPYSLTYRLQYIGKQALAGVEIERQDVEFGPAGTAPEYFVHDASFSIDATERFTFYGGVNNITDKQPYANRVSYPVSPIGRFFFLGARAKF
jgi:outer membrane receptor protein involved in Fe transport